MIPKKKSQSSPEAARGREEKQPMAEELQRTQI